MDDCQFKRLEEKLDRIDEKLDDILPRLSVAEDQLKNARSHIAIFYTAFLSAIGLFAKKFFNLD